MLPVRKTLIQCAENGTRESVIRWDQVTCYQLATIAMSMISLQYWILWSELTVFRETNCGCYRECPSDPVCSEEFFGGVCNRTWPGPGYQTTHTGYMCKIMEWAILLWSHLKSFLYFIFSSPIISDYEACYCWEKESNGDCKKDNTCNKKMKGICDQRKPKKDYVPTDYYCPK